MANQFLYRDDDGVLRWHDEPEGRVVLRAQWPMKSDALGVHPSQIAEARELSVKFGVPTDFTPDGRAILNDPHHRRQYAESQGFYDRNGGYSDPQRKRRA